MFVIPSEGMVSNFEARLIFPVRVGVVVVFFFGCGLDCPRGRRLDQFEFGPLLAFDCSNRRVSVHGMIR